MLSLLLWQGFVGLPDFISLTLPWISAFRKTDSQTLCNGFKVLFAAICNKWLTIWLEWNLVVTELRLASNSNSRRLWKESLMFWRTKNLSGATPMCTYLMLFAGTTPMRTMSFSTDFKSSMRFSKEMENSTTPWDQLGDLRLRTLSFSCRAKRTLILLLDWDKSLTLLSTVFLTKFSSRELKSRSVLMKLAQIRAWLRRHQMSTTTSPWEFSLTWLNSYSEMLSDILRCIEEISI